MPIFLILEKVAETQNTVKKEKYYLFDIKMQKICHVWYQVIAQFAESIDKCINFIRHLL